MTRVREGLAVALWIGLGLGTGGEAAAAPRAQSEAASRAETAPESPSGGATAGQAAADVATADMAAADTASAAAPVPRKSPYRKGYRVQVLAHPSPLQAWRAAEGLRAPDGPPVVIQWEDDLYKVRVGAFTTREGAQAMLDSLKSEQPDAWIVRGVVRRDELVWVAGWGGEEPAAVAEEGEDGGSGGRDGKGRNARGAGRGGEAGGRSRP